MIYDSLMIHYGELSTKGDNRRLFVNQLTHNVRLALRRFPGTEARGGRDHLYVSLKGQNPEPIIARLQEVSGIQKISLVAKLEPTEDALKEAVLALLKEEKGSTFKIDVKRADKSFPIHSYELTCLLADHILDHSSWTVDLHHFDARIKIDIRQEGAYLSCHDYPGLGGYPLGMNGKVMMLLSGGIDSPVATFELIRRGIKVETIHFASPPYTQMAVIDKLKDLLKDLNDYQPSFKLNIIPFTKLQEAIYAHVSEPYCITIMRRMMLRIAVEVAKKEGCQALATGESVGQVASQTLESMQVINEVTNFPILRPLATSDKVRIIDTAKRIGTYEISIRPYEDCCTIFKPKRPKTKPQLDDCYYYESQFDWKSLVDECVNSYTSLYLKNGEELFKEGQ
ncbi:MAG: tRNA 4-thiouridine(8) synthase ThiI [Mollicutes bacterium]|nr:tRNA 4-thiouridine(8) synthase ThiI [Mollicutes bacterium]